MEVKDREKSLIKNTGILAIGTLASKVFSFFLLPLYTAVLTTEDYGTVDVLQTVALFAMPFVTLQLCSVVFRFIIEKKEDLEKTTVITTGIFVESVNVILFSFVVWILNFKFNIQYCELFILNFASSALLEIVQNIIRGFGNNGTYSIMSFIMTVVSLISNAVMILFMGMKGDSILIASTIAALVAAAFGICKQKLWRYLKFSTFSLKELKKMLKYSLPLIPNAISWWIANTSDRLLIRYFIGASGNGIYAAANKIPSIYTTIFNVYNIAWIESLSRSVGDKKQDEFINSMFEKSIRLFACICIGIICCMSLFFNMLIGEAYHSAYAHVYILLIAIFFNSICSLLGGIFTAYKESGIIGKTTVIGAVVNFIVNLMFIKFIGLYAASMSTLISYVVIVCVRTKHVKKFMKLVYPKEFLVQASIALIVVSIGYFMRVIWVNALILFVLFLWCAYSNKELAKTIIEPILNRLGRKHEKQSNN